VNNAVVNEDPNAKLIRELQAEVKQLRDLLKSHVTDLVLNEQLNQVNELITVLNKMLNFITGPLNNINYEF